MNAPAPTRSAPPPPSLTPVEGWHCSHFFYRWDRARLHAIDSQTRRSGISGLCELLDGASDDRPQRQQGYVIAGHKADFCLMLMDPDPLRIERVNQRLLASPLGGALQPMWSFVSMSEVSEYVPSAEQYREKLIREGEPADSPTLAAKVEGYAKRLPLMNTQRLTPEFPDWPAACFYPMNKSRVVGANWFAEPFSRRAELMSEHARSGIKFAGRVTQLISVGIGLDDWEWMVTLWAANPQYLKEIVYHMRFDEASAKYAEFGPFYTGYRASTQEILNHCAIE